MRDFAQKPKRKGHIAPNLRTMNYELTGQYPDEALFRLQQGLDAEERKKYLEKSSLYHIGKAKEGKVYLPTLLSIGTLFALSSDKRMYVDVPMQVKFGNSETKEGRLIRGKIDPSSPTAYGQLNTFDLKVFVAILKLWEKQDYRVMEDKTKSKKPMMVGVVRCSKYELAKMVFPKLVSPSKRDSQFIQDSTMRLQGRPCCFELQTDDNKLFSMGLQLLSGVTWAKITSKEAHEQSSVTLILSEVITEQFRLKRFLVRSIENLTALKGEIPRLLFLYLEPKLLSLPPGTVYKKNLSDLIKELALPISKWHRFASQRFKIFKGVAEELNGKFSSRDGLALDITIIDGVSDYMLVAKLKNVTSALTQESNENEPGRLVKLPE